MGSLPLLFCFILPAHNFIRKGGMRVASRGEERKKRRRAGELIDAALELPPGLLGGGAHIEIDGGREVVVDGCKGVLEYEECLIRLNIGTGQVKFTGQNLLIRSLTANQAQIEGCIESIAFLP